jgi:FkbM family methyltransferase
MAPPTEKQMLTETYVPHAGWLRHESGDEVAELLCQGHFEAEQQAFLWLYMSSRTAFVDAGAHIGLFSIIASRAADGQGRVISVEPNPASAAMLRDNLLANGVQSPEVVEAALWDQSGMVDLSASTAGKSAHVRVVARNGDITKRRVSAITLEQLLDASGMARADIVKLDIEGAEPRVIAAAEHAVRAGRLPVLIVEFTEENLRRNESSTEKLYATLSRLGYVLCDLESETLQLCRYPYASPIWYKNLFAVTHLDEVNQRLARADEMRRRIARDILHRASSASKLKELEDLETWKLRGADAEKHRAWADQTERLLARERALSAQYREWAESAQRGVEAVNVLAKKNQEWAKRTEVLLADRVAVSEHYRIWAETAQRELEAARILVRENRNWAERAEAQHAITKVLSEEHRIWAETAQREFEAARILIRENRNWAEKAEAQHANTKVLSEEYRIWAETAQREFEAARILVRENRNWAERAEAQHANTKVLSDEYRIWAETAQRELEGARTFIRGHREWAERAEALHINAKAVSEQYFEWAQATQLKLKAAHALIDTNRQWAETAQRDLENSRICASENRHWAERAEALHATAKATSDQYREWAELAQRELEATRVLASEFREWAEQAETMLATERIRSTTHLERAIRAESELENARKVLATSEATLEKLQPLLVVIRYMPFRAVLHRVVTTPVVRKAMRKITGRNV